MRIDQTVNNLYFYKANLIKVKTILK